MFLHFPIPVFVLLPQPKYLVILLYERRHSFIISAVTGSAKLFLVAEGRGEAGSSTWLLHSRLCMWLSGFHLTQPPFRHAEMEIIPLTSQSAYED